MQSLPLLKTCSSTDPAVDVRATLNQPGGYRDFHRTRDVKHLQFHKGQEPATFELRRLSHGVMAGWVDQAPSAEIKHMRAFAVGVVRVVGYTATDGRPLALLEHNRHKAVRIGANEETSFDDEDLALINYEDLQEIGEVVYNLAFLRHASAPSYPVPRSFPDALERAAWRFRHADANTEPGPSRPPPDDSTPPTQPASSAVSGDATVTGSPTASEGSRATAA